MYRNYLMWSVLVLFALCIGCNITTVTGGGGSETVAIAISDSIVTGKIMNQTASSDAYYAGLYKYDYMPGDSVPNGKIDVSISDEFTFSCTPDMGKYNLIVTNKTSGEAVIFQELLIESGSTITEKKEFDSPGSVNIIPDSSYYEMVYLKGTPFYSTDVLSDTIKITNIPAGSYTIGVKMIDKGIEYQPVPIKYSVKSDSTTIVHLK